MVEWFCLKQQTLSLIKSKFSEKMNRKFFLFEFFIKYRLKFVMKCVKKILISTLNVMFQVLVTF
jgi:hypothetical protein